MCILNDGAADFNGEGWKFFGGREETRESREGRREKKDEVVWHGVAELTFAPSVASGLKPQKSIATVTI